VCLKDLPFKIESRVGDCQTHGSLSLSLFYLHACVLFLFLYGKNAHLTSIEIWCVYLVVISRENAKEEENG
jgi:hypothetical protein